jgi:hypothetical protein
MLRIAVGDTLFTPFDAEPFFPNKDGAVHSFGLPIQDEVTRLGSGKE